MWYGRPVRQQKKEEDEIEDEIINKEIIIKLQNSLRHKPRRSHPMQTTTEPLIKCRHFQISMFAF